MIRKLFVGSAVAAVAALALLLAVGSPAGKPQPAEATVASISTTTTITQNDWWAQLHIVAEDDVYPNPFNSLFDIRVTATAGDFGGLDGCAILFPVWIQVGCAPQAPPILPSCYYDEFLGSMPCVILASNGFPTVPGFPMLVGPADRDIVICNTGESIGLDYCSEVFGLQGPDPLDLLTNTTEVEVWWRSPGGFPGGTVTFSAWQGSSVKTASISVLGAPATIKLSAMREWGSSEATECHGTPVYVIAAEEYSFNNFTTFDNDRAVLCAEVEDSNGSNLPNVAVNWSTTDGCLYEGAVTFSSSGGLAYNELASCGTGNSGDVAKVTASAGSASASVEVAFGGDPASCSIADFDTDLDIGDAVNVEATIVDSKGNAVPDGIIADFVEVDSGDGADNVQFVTTVEDTVNGVVSAKIIAAIAGVTTVAVVVETIGPGPGDATCSEALDLSGDIHVTPTACADSADAILAGSKPPAAGGWGTFLFCGGTNDQLLAATKCANPATVVIFYNKPNGGWVSWVVGSQVAAANAEWLAMFPNEHVSIPNPTIFTATCKAVA
ncbi:MAG: hypothetical protein AB7I38_05340 [Dehalococcoidia bacterium]